MKTSRLLCILLSLACLTGTAAAASREPRERLFFSDDWRFQKGDPAGAEAALDYARVRPWLLPMRQDFFNFAPSDPKAPAGDPGEGLAWREPAFDDAGWRRLDLPHDWAIEGPFAQELPSASGKLPWTGAGWYRRHFTIAAANPGDRFFLDVDGAMSYSLVWLNGHFVGGWPYGYASFRLDLTPWLKVGGENVLAIRLHNPPRSSRWYPGAGLYRNVWLVRTAPVHVDHWGIFVTTPEVSATAATVDVQVTLKNETAQATDATLTAEIFALDAQGNPSGPAVASSFPVEFGRADASLRPATPELLARPPWYVEGGLIPPGRQGRTSLTLQVPHPKLWSPAQPNRYVVVTTVARDGQVCDRVETPFGIRTIAFDAKDGFLLNGRRLPIQGVCLHHDLGALGAAINTRALERQLEIMREMGCNAVRTSHNPPAPELLELCDRMGLMVMDEAFDAWHAVKIENDYHLLFDEWHEADLRALVRRDRNHPSVILWSIGNEVHEQVEPEGWKLATHLVGLVHEEDRTRPVTAGLNALPAGFNGFHQAVDIVGFNYKPDDYVTFRRHNPAIPVFGSETASTVSSRGEYFFPVGTIKTQGRADFQVSSYDLFSQPAAWPPDVEFRGLDRAPYAAGEFVWTGFDYLGEPTPYQKDWTEMMDITDPVARERVAQELATQGRITVPSRSSYFGIVDLAGFRKDRFYLYQARWRPDLPMAHLLPHWNWPERVGQVTPVHVYSSGDEAELFLNGQSLGRKKRGPLEYRFRWDDVLYQPGELKVVTYKQGRPWAEAATRTTGPASQLLLSADRTTLHADGRDLAFVTLTVADAAGRQVPRSKPAVSFTVSGPAVLVATDNGDATDHTLFQSPGRKAFNGRALAIIRTRAGAAGPITVRATGDGLTAAEIRLQSAPPTQNQTH